MCLPCNEVITVIAWTGFNSVVYRHESSQLSTYGIIRIGNWLYYDSFLVPVLTVNDFCAVWDWGGSRLEIMGFSTKLHHCNRKDCTHRFREGSSGCFRSESTSN